MNAVNLIPADRRTRRMAVSMSPAMLAVVGVLVLVLVGAVLYVSASNRVSTRRAQLAQVTSSTAAWNAAAAKFGVSVQAAEHHSQELSDIRQLIVGRFPWSELLGQVGSLMPAKSALTTMQATTTSATTSGATPTPGATPAATPGATPAATTTPGGPPIPTVALTGCANSQSTVAQVMVQLHRITDVTNVSLASSTNSGSAAGSGSSGGCKYPVQFQLSLTFKAAAVPSATTATGVGATPASTSTGTGSAASASVTSTRGAAQ
ncbi:MAG TPA: hypothetical protein VFN87_02395 [Solirubrobacteraceae bacterium]|nr:hypothetical protein [Solirubrobacteraceae bacterium]